MGVLDQIDLHRQLQSDLVDGNDMFNEHNKQAKAKAKQAIIEQKAKELLDKLDKDADTALKHD